MTVKSGQAIGNQFVVISATGALVNADALPSGTLVINGANDGEVVTVANIATGIYSWSVTLPVLATGQRVQIRIGATIAGEAGGGIVWEDVADTSLASDVAAQVVVVQADLDDPDQYKADVSGLATSLALATAQADLDNPDQYKADVSGLATSVALAAVQSDLDNPDQYKADVSAIPTAAQNADAVWDEALAAHAIAGSTGAALALAGGAGAGAIAWTYNLVSSVDGLPIADADIWVTTDLAGLNVIASGRTDQFGNVTFNLDPGTIYVWRQKSQWVGENPDQEEVV